MIYADVQALMRTMMSPEEVEVFDSGVEVLELYGAIGYLDAFNVAIGSWSTIDTNDQADSLRQVLTSTINYILSMQGVILNADEPMSEKIKVAHYLHELVNYDDADIVLRYLEMEVSPEERFGELMALVGPWSVENAMAKIETIEKGFALGMRDILMSRNEKNQELATEASAQIKSYGLLKLVIGNKPLFADLFFSRLTSIGLELAAYVSLFQNSRNDFATRPLEDTVEDLFGLACLSCDGNGNPLEAVRQHIVSFYPESVKQTQADGILRSLFQRVTSAQT